MLNQIVPTGLFASVSEFGYTSGSDDAGQLPASPPSGVQKKLSHYHCTHYVSPNTPESSGFGDIFQKISDLIMNNDTVCLSDYLNQTDVVTSIKRSATDEKKKLAQLLYKDASYGHARSAFDTDAGYHLAVQPTSDQYMVAAICSLMETYHNHNSQKSQTFIVRRPDYFNHAHHVATLKREKACHTPQHFVDNAIGMTAEFREYFRVHAERTTGNFAKPCPVCFVYTTDAKAHARIFHPQGLARVGKNETPSQQVFSEQFLQLLDSPHLSARVKERLFPPMLYRLFDKVGCDYAALTLGAQLLPEAFLSERLCRSLDLSSKYCIAHMTDWIARQAPEDSEAIVGCTRSLVNFATNIPALALIGAEIKAILQQRQVAIPHGTVAERYLVKKFAMPISLIHAMEKLDDIRASLLAVNISEEPTLGYLAGRGGGENFFSRTAIRDVVRLAMNAVSARKGSDIRPGSSPMFIGHVPQEFADGIAAKDGFLDCNYAGNFLHGKYSHTLALTCMAYQAGLTRQLLATIINSDLWNRMLDQNPHSMVDTERESPVMPLIRLNRTKSVLFNHAPYKLHALLTTGQISAGLEEIAIVISHSYGQDRLLSQFASRMGMPESLTLEMLARLADDIRVLELVLATKHLNSMEQVKHAQSGIEEELHNPGVIHCYLSDGTPSIGNFPSSDSQLERIKAKKCLARKCRVLGIELPDDGFVRSNGKLIEIATEHDIDKCHAFVVYPPSTKTFTQISHPAH